jgi:ABC-type lipoprotein release transport system permease subunit
MGLRSVYFKLVRDWIQKVCTHIRLKCFNTSILLIVLLALATFECHVNVMPVESSTSSVLWGHVLDAATGRPIENATIAIWDIRATYDRRVTRTVTTLKGTTQTEKNGSYVLLVPSDISGRVYASFDDPHSPGYDYVPQVRSVTLTAGAVVNLTFALVPAASIALEGDLLFVDSSRPPDAFGFTVVLGEQLPEEKSWVLIYGSTPTSHSPFLKMDPMQVVFPLNTSFTLEVVADAARTFVIDGSLFAHVEKGEAIQVKVATYTLPYNLNLTLTALQQAAIHVDETADLGFYVTAERRDLEQASSLLDSADVKFADGHYEACYADLREAYTTATYIAAKVQAMYVDAAISTRIIIVFLALTSTALAYLLFETWAKKAIATALFYAVFLAVLWQVYSGCHIVDTAVLLQIVILALLASFFTAFLLPRLAPMTVTAFFSMAKRNLRRRRTRFILTLVTVTALVMSFVALTSFSAEYGFTSTTIQTINLTSDGLLIRKPLPAYQLTAETQIAITFDPFETSVLDWLHSKPEVTLVAPKLENWPTRRPLGSLSTASQRLSIFGVLGLSPSAEVATTGFDQLLVKGQGRYLYDDEEDVIMISVEAADALNVQVGEHVMLRVGGTSLEVMVVGFLDDHGLSHVIDFDGSPMLPDKLIIIVEEGMLVEARVESCAPSEVVVTNWRTALKLSYHVFLSRIDVLAEASVSLLPFARQIALERDYWVWAAEDGHINRLGLMTYLEAKGVSVFIPWSIVILNVVFTMVNAIYERRRELVILSSVGLNPTHITALFVAEAVIVGVIGGGMGYLLGLSLYKFMPLLSSSIFVRQKISAVWCLASLGIAMTAVLVGAFVALKASVDITPSTLRRWKTVEAPTMGTPWAFTVPFRVQGDRVDDLFEYVAARFRQHLYSRSINPEEGQIRFSREDTSDASTRIMDFHYLLGFRSNVGSLPFQLVAKKGAHEATYSFEVLCKGAEETVKDTVSFLRMAIIEWSSQQTRD